MAGKASASSEEKNKNNLTKYGNDGNLRTRWCANGGNPGEAWPKFASRLYSAMKSTWSLRTTSRAPSAPAASPAAALYRVAGHQREGAGRGAEEAAAAAGPWR